MTLAGVRVWLNPALLEGYPLIKEWFERNRGDKPKPPFEDMVARYYKVQDAGVVSPFCFKKPVDPSATIPGKLQQEFASVASSCRVEAEGEA